jgi:TM2 domain-containing membrane protein YozV
MNCQNHPDAPANAFCRNCGKPLCEACRRDAVGTVYCEEHAPAEAKAKTATNAAPPPPPPAPSAFPPPPAATPYPPMGAPLYAGYRPGAPSPGVALGLGFIPGVGAIYNGQYAKGLIHAVIFGLVITIMNSDGDAGMGPLLGLLLSAFEFYMAFEAYHTAWKRRRGEPVDEFSSLVNVHGRHNLPLTGIVLIALGALLLLNTLDLIRFRYVIRYWPVGLICLGVYLLFARFSGGSGVGAEARHER